MRTEEKSLLLKHQTISRLIAIVFIIFSLCINCYVIKRAISDYKNLQQKEGVVDMWYSTSMKTTKACLKIEGDTTIYSTSRPGWWMTLQHDGKKGEKVIFYTLNNEHNATTEQTNRILCFPPNKILFLTLLLTVAFQEFRLFSIHSSFVTFIS